MIKKYFKLLTELEVIFSHDNLFKVSSLILDKDSLDVISVGYNKFVSIHNNDYDREQKINELNKSTDKYNLISHAEEVVINHAKKYNLPLENNILLVSRFPCIGCARLIVNSGLSKVITYEREEKTEWWDDEPSKKIFSDNGVQLETPIRKDNWAPSAPSLPSLREMDNKFQKGPIPISDWTTNMKKGFWDFIVKTMREKSVLKDEKVYDILIAGSVARGDCRPDSDIDVVVLMGNLITDLIKGYTDGYKLPYKDFLNFPIFVHWNDIPVQFCLADRLYDHSYNGYNISNFSLLNDGIVNFEIESDDDVFLSHYQKTKELTMGLDYNPNLKVYELQPILGDIKYREDRYESQISDISNSIVGLFSNMNTGIDNTATLCCLDLIPSDGEVKVVSFNTNCLLTKEIIDNFDFTNFLESGVKDFKVMNLSVGSHIHDSVISEKIVNKFFDKFSGSIKIDAQAGWPIPFKIKEDRENFYIKLTYDIDGLLDMFASKYVVMRDLFESNGLGYLLPKVDDEISIENSNFPDFVSKSLHYPGMSPYGFFDRESVLYTQYKKVDSNKYFEEFIIPDIYLDRNVMIRLYFIIGKVGTFLLSKHHFYHTIHPLKNEDGRYVWKYRN